MLLNIDTQNKLSINLTNVIGECVAVLGIRGSGKTNTAAVLIEELLLHGLPLSIVDIEGEYWGLKEKFEILVIGKSPNVDLVIQPNQSGKIAEFSVKNGVPVILDLSEFSQVDMMDFLINYFKSLWKACFTYRKPYEVVLEEAHEFIPQSTRTPLKEIITRIALRGRKRGLGMILISQRSAKVEKDVLTQAAMLFLHRVVHPIDVKIYQDIIPLPARQVEEIISQLQRGEAIVLNAHTVEKIYIRPRYTFHVGATPEFKPMLAPELRKINESLLAELKNLSLTSNDDETDNTVKKLHEKIFETEAELARQIQINDDLRSQVDLLSKLSISLTDVPVVVQKNIEKQTGDFINPTSSKLTVVEINESTETRRQEKRFIVLLEDIAKLPRLHRTILKFLLERENISMNSKELAKWLKLNETTIKNAPPLELIKMNLLRRSGQRGNYLYQSSVRQLIGQEFPNLSVDMLIEKILARCS